MRGYENVRSVIPSAPGPILPVVLVSLDHLRTFMDLPRYFRDKRAIRIVQAID